MKLTFKNIRVVVFPLVFIAVSGCSTFKVPKPVVTENFQGIHIYSTTSDMQSSFLKDRDSGEHFCDSRSSDVADTQSFGLGVSEALAGQSEGISESSSRGALALGGRSPAVLITREIMYRTCELTMNLNLDKETALDLYIQTLNLVATIVSNDINNGSAAVLGSAQVQNVKLIESENPIELQVEEVEDDYYNPRRR